MKTFFFTFIFCLCFGAAFANDQQENDTVFPQKLTAKDLMYYCSSSYLTATGRLRKKYCAGFISGVEESVRLHDQLFNVKNGQKICLPKGKNASQYSKVYTQYASQKTTDLSKPAASVVIEAFKQAFPCP